MPKQQCLSLSMSHIKYAVSDAGVRNDMISKKQDDIFSSGGGIKDDFGEKEQQLVVLS